MAMTASRLRAFFRPYLRTVYPGHSVFTASGGRDTHEEIWFTAIAGIRAWAAGQGLSTREAVARLVPAGIWPESFRRNYGLFAVHDVTHLLRCRVLVLGCGGLGGHVAELLARTGIGFLRLVDNDVFDESNLNRQRFCAQSTLGRPKAQVVRDALTDIAFHLEAEALQLAADKSSMPELVRGMDAVVDCLDSIGAKLALEKASLAAGSPFVHGSILREEGFAYVNSGPDACLNTLYPGGQGTEELAVSRHEAMGTLAPAAVACLMVKLCLRALLAPASVHARAGASDTLTVGANTVAAAVPDIVTAAGGHAAAGAADTGSEAADKHQGGQAHGLRSPLYHLDLSIPELERFFWG